jgi:hypothetical protein
MYGTEFGLQSCDIKMLGSAQDVQAQVGKTCSNIVRRRTRSMEKMCSPYYGRTETEGGRFR